MMCHQAGVVEVWDLLDGSSAESSEGVVAKPSLKVEEGDKVCTAAVRKCEGG